MKKNTPPKHSVLSGQSTGSREEDGKRFYKKSSARAQKKYAAIQLARLQKTEGVKKRKASRAKSRNAAKKSRK